jgi:hypothetical protein
MLDQSKDIDVNALPVHLFVKSPKDAKRLSSSQPSVPVNPGPYRKARRFGDSLGIAG